jgi:hypothetical protein
MASWIWAVDGNSDIGGGITGLIARLKTRGASRFFPTEWFSDNMASVTVYSVQDMVNKVLMAAGKDKISRLIIYGHGASGFQCVGCETVGNVLKNNCDFLQVALIDGKLKNNAEQYLAQLVPQLATNTVVSLGGCRAGSAPDGETLLKRMSTVLGVKVEAGLSDQMPLFSGYEGHVVRCGPSACTIN